MVAVFILALSAGQVPPLEAEPVAEAHAAAVVVDAPAASERLIPAAPAQASRPLVDRPETGPSLGGFVVASAVVALLLGGAFWLLRRLSRNSRLLGRGGPVRILGRTLVGARQEILLVEAGPRVFLLGSSKDGLSPLGEFSNPDEIAALRADAPARTSDSSRASFREALKEGLDKPETADGSAQAVYASIAEELAELRRTVHAWKA